MNLRTCYCCHCEKELTEFVKDNRNKSGYKYLCKECKRKQDKEYYEKVKLDPEKWQHRLELNRAEKAKHHDKIINYNRDYNRRPEVIERKSDWARKHNKRSLHSVLYHKLWAAKKKAVNKNLPFDLDMEYLESIYTEICPILEISLNWEGSPRTDNTPALDKIIPELGYVKGNVQFISTKANSMKTDATIEQLLTFAKNIKNYLQEKEIVRPIENNESIELEDKEPLG